MAFTPFSYYVIAKKVKRTGIATYVRQAKAAICLQRMPNIDPSSRAFALLEVFRPKIETAIFVSTLLGKISMVKEIWYKYLQQQNRSQYRRTGQHVSLPTHTPPLLIHSSRYWPDETPAQKIIARNWLIIPTTAHACRAKYF